MPTTYKSPFATSFKTACKRGNSFNVTVNNIAKRCNKTPEFVWQSLFKADLCYRQKFNGQWVYFPCEMKKSNATTCKNTQFTCWQWFCEWCLATGNTTPEKMWNNCGTQKNFMVWCRKFWNRQFTSNVVSKPKSRKKTRTYSFPSGKKRTYRRAA